MRKYFRFFSAAVAIIMSMALMSACSKKPAVTPDQYLTFYMDLAVKNTEGDAAKLGISSDEVKKFKDQMESQYSKVVENDTSGVDKDSLNKMVTSIRKGMSQIKYDIKTVESDSKSAKVEMSINPMVIDQNDFSPDKLISQDEIMQLASQYTDQATLQKKATEMVIDKLCKYFENPKISDEAKKVTIELKVEKGEWKEVNEGTLENFIKNNLIIYK